MKFSASPCITKTIFMKFVIDSYKKNDIETNQNPEFMRINQMFSSLIVNPSSDSFGSLSIKVKVNKKSFPLLDFLINMTGNNKMIASA